MNQIATTIKQSKKLIELGIDVNTADMYYYKENVFNNALATFNGALLVKGNSKPEVEYTIPAWSLSALLSLIKPVNENSYTIQGTLDGGAIISFEEVTSIVFQEDNILDAVFEMVCYLIEMNLLDN